MSYVIVTGGSKNIGKEIATQLAKNGHDIAIHYRKNREEVEVLEKELQKEKVKVKLLYGDFSQKEGIESFVCEAKERLGKIKGIINNAAVYKLGGLNEISFDDLHSLFLVNLFTPFYLINSLIKELSKEKGFIVNIGMCGLFSKLSDDWAAGYQMSKLALLMLTKSFAKSLAKEGVRVNMVSPGYSETSVGLPPKSFFPLGRPSTNKEIAEAVLFFIKNEYVTGQNLEVAGGVRL